MKKKLFYGLYLFSFILIASELLFRWSGHKPGFTGAYNKFKPVDSLIVYDLYTTDEYGIYKFNIDFINSHKDSLGNFDSNNIFGTEQVKTSFEVFKHLENQVLDDNETISSLYNNGADSIWNTEFPKAAIKNFKDIYPIKVWSKLFAEYLHSPFNNEGFKSIPFDAPEANIPKVLLLGDSYVYGMSAQPIFNSFSDILLSRGYIVYNTGIAGTDPAQYAAVARKYIPILKPDIVIMNFYRTNDFMSFERTPKKNQPHEHFTNVGFLQSMPAGEYLSAKDVYEFYLDIIKIPDTDKNLFNFISSKSTFLSVIWGYLNTFGIVKHKNLTAYKKTNFGKSKIEQARITNTYIKAIDKVCKAHSAKLINVIIPEKYYPQLFGHYISYKPLSKKVLYELFKEISYYYPYSIFDNTDYYNAHFNNKGSLKYANYLDSLINIHSQKKPGNLFNRN